MPSRAASAFIMSTKPCSEPPTVSAIATAISLADFTSIIFSALSSVMLLAGLEVHLARQAAAAACLLITTGRVEA